MTSVERIHPEWDRFVLLVGGEYADEDRFTTVPLDALSLPSPRQFCFRYTLLELNTAVKPWMFAYLFERGYDRVIYFDPDIVLYSRLEEIDTEDFLTLTPHLTRSISGDVHPSERTILQAGAYNLGFLAVTRNPQLDRFLGWWQEKLEFLCRVDVAHGLFVDQKWMDLAPGLYSGVSILRHEGYNVAYWNLRQRTVALDGATATVNGQPLRFFHFSGFDPARRDMVSKHDASLRLIDAGDAWKLVEDYRAALQDAGSDQFRNSEYAFSRFTDGTPLPNAARFAYRKSEPLQAAAGPDPFAHPEVFAGLRDTQAISPLRAKAGLASYRLLSQARPIVRLIPSALRVSMREFLLGRKERTPVAIGRGSALPPGMNIVGYFERDTGVGESARLFRRSCERAGLASHCIDVDGDALAQQAVYRTSVYHVNGDRSPDVHRQLHHVFDASAYNIGVWHWELPEMPDTWIASAEPFDEIWAPSGFVQSAVSRKVSVPVVLMPHGVEVTDIEPCSPGALGVPPGRFVFLCVLDLASVVQRKNPLAAAEAFRRAFPHESSAALLIKASHAGNHHNEYADLQAPLRGVPGVYLIDRLLSRARLNGLLASCDAVVSLHRSEGFGLIPAEAMALGKPVVATGWSGNMDFMNSGNSCPVGFQLVTLDRTFGPYPVGAQWAEPDVDHASRLMRRLVDDSAYRREIGERARETMRTQFSPEAAGLRYTNRLAFLGLMHRQHRT
jgi:glycosyltransferase involved in cell wall biosynthesis